jgi:hypothetical protein
MLLFSYGSNGRMQLLGRIGRRDAQALATAPALLHGYSRCFCGFSSAWGGSVASLHACPGGCTYGHVVELSDEEMCVMDGYEAGYRREMVTVSVGQEGSSASSKQACVYIKNDTSFDRPPSQAYLTAIHIMLREHWPAPAHSTITIARCCVRDGTLQASPPQPPLHAASHVSAPGI